MGLTLHRPPGREDQMAGVHGVCADRQGFNRQNDASPHHPVLRGEVALSSKIRTHTLLGFPGGCLRISLEK